MNTSFLSRAPFHLDQNAVAWVESTCRALRLPDKVAQLFIFLSRGNDPQELETLAALHDRGKLTDHEYQQAKSKHVGVDLSEVGGVSARASRTGPMV